MLKTQRIKISPVIGRSRVAPLERVTLPTLELCAALLLAQQVALCQTIFPVMLDMIIVACGGIPQQYSPGFILRHINWRLL